jgi:hypothetical protein
VGNSNNSPCEYGEGKFEGEIEVDKGGMSYERDWGILRCPHDSGLGSLALGPGTYTGDGSYDICSNWGRVRLGKARSRQTAVVCERRRFD